MHPLDWTISPEEALAHWPDDVPLAALVTCAPDPAWGRWSMRAVAGETLELHDAAEALAAIRRAGEGGTWCAAISYELGGVLLARGERAGCLVRGARALDGPRDGT
ncbi:MAG: hypothetical protein ACKOFI_06095, partial [Phycisphaerales bacterium]